MLGIERKEFPAMFSTLAVPLDGSPLAERALPYAIRMAQASQGRLILIRAALAPAPYMIDGSYWEQDQLEVVEEAEAYLREIAESIAGQVRGVEIAVPYGRAAAQILEAVAASKADGIVMATHGRTGLPHLLYGSVTEAVLASSSVPVFVVYARPGEAVAPAFSPTNARVLVTQDGSAYDAPAADAAIKLVGAQGEIVLVTVLPPPDHVARDEMGHVIAYLDQQEESDKLQAREYLTAIADQIRARGTQVRVKIDVRVGDPVSGIAMAAIDDSADVIVMATHGRTGIQRAVFGSVAGTVLRAGPTPVMLIHPHPETPISGTPERVESVEAKAQPVLGELAPLY